MAFSFYFYDLETSGFNPRSARIMQFAGQRADANLKAVGKSHNCLITLTEDVVPDPDAILITGITPQQTRAEGMTEAEFLKFFHEEVATPDTVFVGFNNVRFDDEFMRYLHYRNFYDPYEWQWQDGRGRWDLLDVVRMTRALRPDSIVWPFDSTGKPSNRLELLTSVNKLDHSKAHDALSDVNASLAVARLIRNKQPKLFDFLLGMRDKKRVSQLVYAGQPFLYASGKYDSQWEKTTAVAVLAGHPERQGVFVYDLRYDPEKFISLTPAELAKAWLRRRDEPGPRLPVKTLLFNRCPAIAPLTVLDKASSERLALNPDAINQQFKKLQASNLAPAVMAAWELLDKKQQAKFLVDELDVDAQLYEGFFSEADRTKMSIVRAAEVDELANLSVSFKDQRLEALLPLYKARNFPQALTNDERGIWDRFKERKLLGGKEASRLARYFERISELNARTDLNDQQRYLLEELALYGESVMPLEP